MKHIVNEEAKKNNQTQLKTTGRNVEGEKKCTQSSEKYEKRSALSQRSKVAADAM